jgi:electron transfer flavoprotein beta subunit
LKIVVCIKQVPDSAAKITAADGEVTWGDAPLVMNPWDEYAVEAALQQKDERDADVTVLSVGAEAAKEALKTALAMGCGEAILVSDPALAGADSQAVAQVLAAAIRKIGGVDAAFFGRQAIDGDMGVTAAQTARYLGWPLLGLVAAIPQWDNVVRVERTMEEGRQVVEADLPVVMSIVKEIGEARYPSFINIRKANKATIPTWSLSDLGIEAPQAQVSWPEVENPPTQSVQTEILSGSPQEIAAQLVAKLMAEKVL